MKLDTVFYCTIMILSYTSYYVLYSLRARPIFVYGRLRPASRQESYLYLVEHGDIHNHHIAVAIIGPAEDGPGSPGEQGSDGHCCLIFLYPSVSAS